jgi:hypothetical protein
MKGRLAENMDPADFYTFAAIIATLAIAWYVWRL